MADITEIQAAVVTLLEAATSKEMIYETPKAAANNDCLTYRTLSETPANDYNADPDKIIEWVFQLNVWSTNKTRNAATAALIEAALVDKPEMDGGWATANFRIIHSRNGPWNDLTVNGRLWQRTCDWRIRAVRNA